VPEAATLGIETARVFRPLLEDGKRYRGAWGGRGSGKSWFFADLLIERFLLRPTTRAVCIREVQNSLAESVKLLIEDRINVLGVADRFSVLDKHIETPQGGLILFRGMNTTTAQSLKSLESFDIAWVEEAQSLSIRSLRILEPTIRKPGSEIWFSWNPSKATDPIDVFLRGPHQPENAVVVKALYTDNPWATDEILEMATRDRLRDMDTYAHVWLGDYERKSEARVFKKWRVGAVGEFTGPADGVYYFGADWGFAKDPTVLMRCYLSGRTLYVDREVFAVGCEIDATPALFDSLDPLNPGMARRWPITADSARPETISYMQRHGYGRIQPAKKGAGSVEDGVAFLQSCDIVVHPTCTHAIEELTLYSYKTDPLTDQVLPILEDKKNHVIDAIRYALESVRRPTTAVAAILPKRTTDWQRAYFR